MLLYKNIFFPKHNSYGCIFLPTPYYKNKCLVSLSSQILNILLFLQDGYNSVSVFYAYGRVELREKDRTKH